MTKKDYIKFADLIKTFKQLDSYKENESVKYFVDWTLTQELGNIFAKDNERFDYRRFIDYINK